MVGTGWRLAGLISTFLGQTPSRGHLDLLHKMYTQMGDRLSEISPTFAPSFFLSSFLPFLLRNNFKLTKKFLKIVYRTPIHSPLTFHQG